MSVRRARYAICFIRDDEYFLSKCLYTWRIKRYIKWLLMTLRYINLDSTETSWPFLEEHPRAWVMTMMLRFWPFEEGLSSYSRYTTTLTMLQNDTLNGQRKKQEDSSEIQEKSLSEASWHFGFITRMTPISPNHDVFTSFKALYYQSIEYEYICNEESLDRFTLVHRNWPSLSSLLFLDLALGASPPSARMPGR